MGLFFIADGCLCLGQYLSLFFKRKKYLSFRTKMTHWCILNLINHSEGRKRQTLKTWLRSAPLPVHVLCHYLCGHLFSLVQQSNLIEFPKWLGVRGYGTNYYLLHPPSLLEARILFWKSGHFLQVFQAGLAHAVLFWFNRYPYTLKQPDDRGRNMQGLGRESNDVKLLFCHLFRGMDGFSPNGDNSRQDGTQGSL